MKALRSMAVMLGLVVAVAAGDGEPGTVDTKFWTVGATPDEVTVQAGAHFACRSHGLVPVQVERRELRIGTYQTFAVTCGTAA